jgi:hypothetical protein
MKWQQPEQLETSPADFACFSEAAGPIGGHDTLVFPQTLTHLRDDLQACCLAVGEIALSVAVGDRCSHGDGRLRRSVEVGIRAPVQCRDGPRCAIEIFALAVMPGTNLDEIAVTERRMLTRAVLPSRSALGSAL